MRNPSRRMQNTDRRNREHLTPSEVEALIAAARGIGRHRHRDATMILIAFRHALRVSELIALRWDQVDLAAGRYSYTYLFGSERQGPVSAATARKMIARAGERAGLPFPVHPHMLRHATGYFLASKGFDLRAIQHYMGHR